MSRIRQAAQDRCDAIMATVDRWEQANRQAAQPARRPSRAGRTSGHGEGTITYGDPTGQTAAMLTDLLAQVEQEMVNRRDDDWRLAALLAEWAPARTWRDIRRCGAKDCARPHHAQGLCDMHYRREKRAS